MGNGKTGVRRQNLKCFQQEGVLVEEVLVVDKICVPIFGHRISHKSEMHRETSRNQPDRSFSPSLF